MKLLVASLLVGGGTLLPSADLPPVDADECAVVSVDVQAGPVTYVDPDPAATAMRIVVYCGHRVQSGETSTRVDRGLKIIEVDLESAEVIAEAANGIITSSGEVFLSE